MSKYVTPLLVLVVAVLAVALFMRGSEVLTALAVQQTNTSAVTANVSNVAPSCGPMTCYDADDTTDFIDLVGGGKRYVKCNTTCDDPNGQYDMTSFKGHISTAGAGPCTADNRNCYVNNSCENVSVGNNTAYYITCSYWFWFNADNTSKSGDWTGNITAIDAGGLSGYATDTIDVAELLAIGVDSVLAFGTKTPAQNDTVCAKSHNIYNAGNVQIDFQVNASTMTCDQSGSIPPGYIAANLTANGEYDVSYHLSTTLGGPDTGNKFNANLDENNTATTQPPIFPSKATYWGIGIPSGVLGNCQGTIWFAAVSS